MFPCSWIGVQRNRFYKGDCRSVEQIKDRGVTSLSLDRSGKVICNSWNDTSGPGVCQFSPAAFVIMNITEGEKETERETEGG